MKCPKCLRQVSDDATFCGGCGAKLSDIAQDTPVASSAPNVASQASSTANAASNVASENSQAAPATPNPSAHTPSGAPTTPNPSAQQQSASAPAYTMQPQQSFSQEGCLRAAWRDIKSTPNWFKKIFLLCLIGWIPILSFGVSGYALNWSKELFYGKRNTLPGKIFRKGEIVEGFKATIVMLGIALALYVVVTLALALIAALIGIFSVVASATIITVISFILTIIILIYFGPFMYIAAMRMSIVGHLEAGFNFKDIWSVYGKNKASGVFIFFMPILIITAIVFVILLILGGIVGACAATTISSIGSMNPASSLGANGFGSMGSMSTVPGYTSSIASSDILGIISQALSGGSAI
ncbi:MAG: DUF4013 domain-containing protein, partial [Coriobacteriales bacterium]|nr:DUF4013 domain-containing protein [Coriobacteriales bacterium]